ncbi:MAG: NAD(+)--dinitrogen-reductase ADP-D-ribosyltransferase [Gammaproteobacteria bacterium]|nr:NAD(+)--dinitrogen-reductase ADP-D-ribosyltransferase [Gammaproteobacteria bacterium]
MDDDNCDNPRPQRIDASLPRGATLPFNRCSLPARLIGSLTFQRHPTALALDGVASLHQSLFDRLATIDGADEREALFRTHMAASFLLDHPDEAGYDAGARHPGRRKADYLRLLRGWMFDSDSREGAVIKGWAESRFGLTPRSHRGMIRQLNDATYHDFCIERAVGLLNTNALDAQLDLLYSYCQFELARRHPGCSHLTLYRGINQLDTVEQLTSTDTLRMVLLINNVTSFADSADRAGEFGDHVVMTQVPIAKILFYPGLLHGTLQGENEHVVIGGLYEVTRVAM